MNGLQFYTLTKTLTRGTEVYFDQFIDPLQNNPEDFIDIQFVNEHGKIIPPWTNNNKIIPASLLGPFYKLDIERFYSVDHSEQLNIPAFSIGFQVKLPNGKTGYSKTISGMSDGAIALAKVRDMLVNMGYKVDREKVAPLDPQESALLLNI